MKKLNIPYSTDEGEEFIFYLPDPLLVLYDSFEQYLRVVATNPEPSFWSY